ncbi:unnamed protein product [Rhizophagus irregularis]|nr:unnamed protein product [Rhizophagus irregularis]
MFNLTFFIIFYYFFLQGNRLQYGYRNPAGKSAPIWIPEFHMQRKSAPIWIPEFHMKSAPIWIPESRKKSAPNWIPESRNQLQIGYRNPAGKSSPICRNKWELRNLTYTGFVRKLG